MGRKKSKKTGATATMSVGMPAIGSAGEADDGYSVSGSTYPYQAANYNYTGEKFPGGFGTTRIWDLDYWTLRQRSEQLFRENTYARGIVRRLVTNIVNTGLNLESTPEASVLGMDPEMLSDWSEEVEARFNIWASNPALCDYKGRNNFGTIQETAYYEALVNGDVLVVLRQDPVTKLPKVELINGNRVRNPVSDKVKPRAGNEIKHGVELSPSGRQVAYWVDDKRIPVWGEKSKRRVAWLYYATPKRNDDVRGEPLLSICLQPLKEVDRYRDAASRKANINAMLAMWVEKGEAKLGTKPMSGGAIRRKTVQQTTSDGSTRTFNFAEQVPGVIVEELQHGETIKTNGGAGTDVNLGPFEEVIIQGLAWAHEIPPEILRLAFSNNYSASQAAINEFKMLLNKERTRIGSNEMCAPIYVEWLTSEVLQGKIQAPGFLQAWRTPTQYDIYTAWILSDWSGAIKPSTDIAKQVKGYEGMVENAWITHARTTRELNGMKFSKVVKQLKRENEMLADAMRPKLELEREFGQQQTAQAMNKLTDRLQGMTDHLQAVTEDVGETG